MKLAYEAPEIIYEDFSLSASIAAGCEFKTQLQAEGVCGYMMEGDVVFAASISGCKYIPPEEEEDTICYHNPSDLRNIYTS